MPNPACGWKPLAGAGSLLRLEVEAEGVLDVAGGSGGRGREGHPGHLVPQALAQRGLREVRTDDFRAQCRTVRSDLPVQHDPAGLRLGFRFQEVGVAVTEPRLCLGEGVLHLLLQVGGGLAPAGVRGGPPPYSILRIVWLNLSAT